MKKSLRHATAMADLYYFVASPGQCNQWKTHMISQRPACDLGFPCRNACRVLCRNACCRKSWTWLNFCDERLRQLATACGRGFPGRKACRNLCRSDFFRLNAAKLAKSDSGDKCTKLDKRNINGTSDDKRCVCDLRYTGSHKNTNFPVQNLATILVAMATERIFPASCVIFAFFERILGYFFAFWISILLKITRIFRTTLLTPIPSTRCRNWSLNGLRIMVSVRTLLCVKWVNEWTVTVVRSATAFCSRDAVALFWQTVLWGITPWAQAASTLPCA